jgi:hypothetical protein
MTQCLPCFSQHSRPNEIGHGIHQGEANICLLKQTVQQAVQQTVQQTVQQAVSA